MRSSRPTAPSPTPDHPLFAGAGSVLCVGIGGGGDVVGALGAARAAEAAGLRTRLGGVTWERRPIDPLPGPRTLAEVTGAEPLHGAAALATPQTRGVGADGPFAFAESHMARVTGEPVLLVDPNPGPKAVAGALDAAAEALACDLVALVDVGGDVLGHGDEPGLASPLCDAVMLAASAHMATPSVAAVFGTGCDGELTTEEVLARIAEVAAAGGLLGVWGLTPADADALDAAVAEVPTEASAMAVRCARGALGRAEIRQGRRTVPLSPVGALTFFLDPAATMSSAARLAGAVVDCESLEAAQQLLAARGVRTELDYEREMAVPR